MEIRALAKEERFQNTVIGILIEAGKLINATKQKHFSLTQKGKGDFVTSIDKEVERFLVKHLKEILPQAGFIAEENEYEKAGNANWIIDPIDGTGNFLSGLDYSISVALQYDKETLLGVVYVPLDELIYMGIATVGAFKIKDERRLEKLKVIEFQDDEGIVFFGLPYNREKTNKIFSIAEKIYPITSDIKRIGPASVDICRVAEGIGKLYFELDLKIWDIAAGELILKEAGGEMHIMDDLYLFGSRNTIQRAKEKIGFAHN